MFALRKVLRNSTLSAAAVLAAAALTATGCGSRTGNVPVEGKEVGAVTARAERVAVPRTVTATAGLEAATTVMISTRMMGWVEKVHVQAGDRVEQGDPLISIDDSDLMARKTQAEAGIAEARAVLANAETTLGRFERLYDEKSVSKAQLDEVRTGRDRAAAGLEMAKAGLREVNVHLGYLDIVAPVSGLVARRMIEPGNMANPGMPLMQLEEDGRVKVVAHLSEKDVSSVQPGDPMTVAVTSLEGAVHETTIARVVQTANRGSGTYDVEGYLENEDPRLKSGMFARVTIPVGEREIVRVPADAVVRRGQLTGVWTVGAEGRAALQWVRLGRESGGRIEVISGLAGDETVVVSADAPLVEGDKVVTQR